MDTPAYAPMADASMPQLKLQTASPAARMSVVAARSVRWSQQASGLQHVHLQKEVTPSTSASSSPRQVPLPTPCGLSALQHIALRDCSLQLEDRACTGTSGATASTSAFSSPREEALLQQLVLSASPHGILPPPGLMLPAFRPPPGLPHPRTGVMQASQPLPTVAPSEGPAFAEWRIQNIFSKLRVSSGFALVSPPLQLGEFSDVRLQFSPGEGWAASARNPKGKATNFRTEVKGKTGSEHGTVSLKLGNAAHCGIVEFYIFVGAMRQGPFECDFAKRAVHELQLNLDWRKHLEIGSLPLRLYLVKE